MTSETYSNIKIFKHMDKLRSIQNGVLTSPITIRLKPTNVCQHNCFYCAYRDTDGYMKGSYGFNKMDSIPLDIMKQLLKDIIDMGVKGIILSGGGEPLIYEHIEYVLSTLNDNNIDVGIITNGKNLDKVANLVSEAKWVRVSLDATDPELYSSMRGVKKDEVVNILKGMKHFASIKKLECELGVNYVVNHRNYNNIYDTIKVLKEVGVDHVKFAPRAHYDMDKYHEPFAQNAIDEIEKGKEEFEDENFRVINKYVDYIHMNVIFDRPYKFCPMQQIVPCIAADSWVYICHDKAYFPTGRLGSLKDKTFREIWFSEETYDRFKNFNAKEECKHHCAWDQRNIIINEFLELNEDNVNFI